MAHESGAVKSEKSVEPLTRNKGLFINDVITWGGGAGKPPFLDTFQGSYIIFGN